MTFDPCLILHECLFHYTTRYGIPLLASFPGFPFSYYAHNTVYSTQFIMKATKND